MQIINPIYDSAFKYLMDNNQVARLVISAIIGEEVEELLLDATELKVDVPVDRKKENEPETSFFTILRIDFAARIKTSEGQYKEVLIEIQKAKLSSDIMRFRRYLGEKYANENVSVEIKGKKKALPLLPIYFLGHPLRDCESTVLKVNRQYEDVITGKVINTEEEFIESLTHNCFIVQIAKLNKRRRNDLEALLSIFDQENKTSDNHILNIKEEEVPEKYRPVLRRLREAISEPKVRNGMKAEDEVINELQFLERQIEEAKAREEEERKQKEEAKAREEEERRQKEEAKAREKATILEMAKMMIEFGKPEDEIAKKTGLSIEEINQLKKSE